MQMTGLMVVGVVVGAFVRRPKHQAQPKLQTTKISASSSRDNAKTFIEAYEERGRISERIEISY
jgi:hypothetical protein